MLTYRSDVDGLRAIAVLAVVVYHARESLLPGGFIGVDVFFVISGYLITKLIAGEIAKNTFSIGRFYVRRAKRILPALFVVLIASWLLGLWLLIPTEMSGLGRTMAATAAFVSNVTFWQDTGYFDITAERKPFLHTWSLAVEEQFYVLWPLALLLAARTRINVRHGTAFVIVVSFVLSCYTVLRHPPSAFFLLPPRAWELLVGAALALNVLPFPKERWHRNVCATGGLAMIAAGLILIGRETPFPGWSALLPCLGAALIIAAGEHGDNVVARWVLSLRPMVFVGLISYSLYLWHWPLLSIARLTQRGTLTPIQTATIVALAVGLAVLTWRFVERPFRAREKSPATRPVLLRYAALSIVVFAIGAGTYRSSGFIDSASPDIRRIESARFDVNPLAGSCLRWQAETGPLPADRCITGQEQFARKLVMWGDSHADSAAPGVVRWAAEHGLATYQLTMAGCPPLVNVEVAGPGTSYAPCTEFRRRVLDYVTEDPDVEAVVLSARWTLYTENARFGPDDAGPITYLVDEADKTWSPEASKRAFSRSLEATISALRRSGKSVIVMGTIPPLGVSVPDCLARNHMPFSGLRDCSPQAGGVLPHMRFADSEVDRVTTNRPGVCGFLPSRALCSGEKCQATSGDEILYANDDHLSLSGALHLSQFFDFERCVPGGETADLRPAGYR